MTTYTLDVDGFDIVIKNDQKPATNKTLSHLFSTPKTKDNFTKKQKKIVILDCIKDGATPSQMQGFKLFPGSGLTEPVTNAKTLLEDEENIILAELKPFLTFQSWVKLKKNHPPSVLTGYTHVFWECGLGADTFNVPHEKMVTFGSAIDPLAKTGTKWPPTNDTILITKEFMELTGFSKSMIKAITLNNGIMTVDGYQYTVKVSENVSNNVSFNTDIIFDSNFPPPTIDGTPNPLSHFTTGNQDKEKLFRESGKTQEKILFIIIKEWGDKLQVFFYIIFYYMKRATATATVNPILNTCDMVVFIICALFHAQCLYNGVLSASRIRRFFPGFPPRDSSKKYYSLLTFSSKTTQEIFGIEIAKIEAENNFFMDSIQKLFNDPSIHIDFQGKPYALKPEFYENCLQDMRKITSGFTHALSIIGIFPDHHNVQMYEQLKQLQTLFLLVPFIKIKKGTRNTLIILNTKSYTLSKENKKAAFRNSTKSFMDLGYGMKQAVGAAGGKITGGGKDLPQDLIKYFCEDDDFDFTDRLTREGGGVLYSHKDIEDQITKYLFERRIEKHENVLNTIYTLFVYISYSEFFLNINFDDNDIKKITKNFDIDIYIDLERAEEAAQEAAREAAREAVRAEARAEARAKARAEAEARSLSKQLREFWKPSSNTEKPLLKRSKGKTPYPLKNNSYGVASSLNWSWSEAQKTPSRSDPTTVIATEAQKTPSRPDPTTVAANFSQPEDLSARENMALSSGSSSGSSSGYLSQLFSTKRVRSSSQQQQQQQPQPQKQPQKQQQRPPWVSGGGKQAKKNYTKKIFKRKIYKKQTKKQYHRKKQSKTIKKNKIKKKNKTKKSINEYV